MTVPMLLTLVLATPYEGHGWHGGYYLTNEYAYARALDALFALLEAVLSYKAVLELEPYTLERMQQGEKFAVERRGREKPRLLGWQWGGRGEWRADFLPAAARSGRGGVRLTLQRGTYVNCCQPLSALPCRGKTLVFSGWIRAEQGRGAHLYLDAWDQSRVLPGSARLSERVPPDGKWHRVELAFPVPPQAVTLFPQAKIAFEPGRADFDDLSLTVKDTGEEMLYNGGFEEMRTPSLQDKGRLERLRELVGQGRVEVVGGAYTQPILYTIGAESAVRQFVLGCRAVEEAVGKPVKVYAAQEPDMIGQLPQMLRRLGFRGVLYRTHWAIFGSAPSYEAEKVWWVGPDGSRIECVPAPNALIAGYGLRGPSPATVEACRRAGVLHPLFTFFGDFAAQHLPGPASAAARGRFGGGYVNLCRRLEARALRGKEVVLSGWIRARKEGAHLYIDAHNAAGRATAGLKTSDVPPDNAWHRAELRFRVPDDAVYLFPQGRILALEGDADFDALSLRVPPEGKELLPRGSFEAPTLPEGWGIGHSRGVQAEGTVVAAEAQEGQRCVRLRMRAPFVQVKFVTLSEYFDLIGEPKEEWPDAFARFEHRFPWGLLAGRPQRADRRAEDLALRTERLLALAGRGASEELADIWRLILIGHHHDAWVCAPVVFGIWSAGFRTYAEMAEAAAAEARERCDRLVRELAGDQGREFVVANVSGWPREEVVPLRLTLPPGAVKNPSFLGPNGQSVPAEVKVVARHPDGSAREVAGWLWAETPSLGYVCYRVVEGVPAPLPAARMRVRDGRVTLANEFLRLEISPEGLLQAYTFEGQPLLRTPAYLTGWFPEGELRSRVEAVTGRREGPYALAQVRGHLGKVPFTGEIRLAPRSPLVRLQLEFDFGEKTEVGEGPQEPRLPRFSHDERKLRLALPLPYSTPRFYTQGAFELRQAPEERYMALRYAFAEGEGRGVAAYTDRATAIICRREPASLEVVLAYGGYFIYAPQRYAPLTGRERYELALYFYEGSAATARVCDFAEMFSQPLSILSVGPGFEPASFSRLTLEPEGAVVLTAAYPEGEDLVLRLWRPYADEAEVAVEVAGARELWKADLRGRPQERLSVGTRATLRLHQAQIVTLRVKGSPTDLEK